MNSPPDAMRGSAPGIGTNVSGEPSPDVSPEELVQSRTNHRVPAEQVRPLCESAPLDSEAEKAFVADCARNIEGLRSDRELKETWGLGEREWVGLAENVPLLNSIKAERERRIRSGEAAREAAQRHFVNAPSILNQILQNETISPRHRIEAAKELRQVAGGVRENAASGEKIVINIDLGEDHRLIKEFNQPARAPGEDGEPQ